jgi:uncharacterized protein (TIGR02145 family)
LRNTTKGDNETRPVKPLEQEKITIERLHPTRIRGFKMKKIILLVQIVLAFVNMVIAQTITTEEGVVINGVKWATRNVDAPGTFAENPEDTGMLYQWNRKIGWSATDPMEGSNGDNTWDSSIPTGTIWEKSNDPSPVGWRVPTLEEIETLLDTDKVDNEWILEKNGRKFTDKMTNNSLFLPAVGYRYGDDGSVGDDETFSYMGTEGVCWSSTPHISSETNAYNLYFGSDYAFWTSKGNRSFGFSIRSVKEVPTTAINEISVEKGKNVLSYYSILGEKLPKEPISGLYIILYSDGKAVKMIKK